MLEPARTRALPLINRSVELAPAAQACCGACKACVTTNLLALAVAGVACAAVHLGRLGGRIGRRAAR